MPYAFYDNSTKALFSSCRDNEPMATDTELASVNRVKKHVSSLAGVWDTTLLDFVVPEPVPNVLTPVVTKEQATAILKTLIETNPATWTATQERQAIYALLLFAFKDFKNGRVY